MYRMHCILYVPKNMTWDEAMAICRSMGGNLAIVFQRDEAYDIMEELQKVGNQHGPVWVGGTKNQFAPWNNDYDNCSQGTAEKDCLQITFEGMACKDDVQCDARLPSVCGIVIM
ncbi:lactose-binding lectin l-2-like isoform X2 [Anabas testudineus]|uniref:lactose-binding lectin l-2-like isoform X2 n=1 Tax=Anabas testudineus TaxID=64144 RepID=UPI000E45BCF2|nr:lactose-binding lectin l-2-like isoform X2 [Anabas testudineus]